MNKYVEQCVPLIDFLSKFLGENTEIVLHDLTDWNNSVVAIRNGHISGREVGSPVTDMILQILNEARYKDVAYMLDYQSRSQNGHILKSATYFIKDKYHNIVGMLCLNSDYQELVEAKNLLGKMLDVMNVPEETAEVTETLHVSVTDLIEDNIRKVYPDISVKPHELSQKEKVEIVSRLNDLGTFLMKGSVGYVAEILEVSIPTIYRYLNMLKKEAPDEQ